MKPYALLALCGCTSAQWTDTFTGQDTRTLADASVSDEAGGSDAGPSPCDGLVASKQPVGTITVTFPGYNTPSSTIHVATSTATCDANVDTTQDGVLFASDALACAPLLAPGSPTQASAIASAVDPNGGPTNLQFQWSYGQAEAPLCVLLDDYALSKK